MNQNINTGKNPAENILEKYRNEVGSLVDKNVWDIDYTDLKVDEESKGLIAKFAKKCRGNIRLRAGLFYTEKEREKEKQELLNARQRLLNTRPCIL